MHWIEPISFPQYIEGATGKELDAIKADKMAEIEKRLGGKIKSIREVHLSRTGSADWVIGEALVELP